MSASGEGGGAEAAPEPGPKRLPPAAERFVKAIEKSTLAGENVTEAVAALLQMVGHKDDGLIAAIDDLREVNLQLADQIFGLRKDMRAAAKARGVAQFFDLLR